MPCERTKTKQKEINVVITFHCVERMRERLTFISDDSYEQIIERLGKQLSEGFIRHNPRSNSVFLGFENVGFVFILKQIAPSTYNAVTFKHKLKPVDKGTNVKVSYLSRKETYSEIKPRSEKMQEGTA